MDSKEQPLVSVVTPVYNGELFIRECIESVLGQTYGNYEYIIVNNCSRDKTFEIAQYYADRDTRIKVVSNKDFVGVIENHNIAFRLISRTSKYCKVVSADDWIYPECIARLVEVAESHPSIGIVGSYAIREDGVRWLGLPHDITFFRGREVCRLYLLGKIDFFGMPSGVLYRSAIVRSRDAFFPGTNPNADAAACFNCLQGSDFGLVHRVLYFERVHDKAISTKHANVNAFTSAYPLQFLVEYGAAFLSTDELKERIGAVLRDYYRQLAAGILSFRETEFFSYHKQRLRELGYPLDGIRLARAICVKLMDLLLNPKLMIEKIVRRHKRNRNNKRRRSSP